MSADDKPFSSLDQAQKKLEEKYTEIENLNKLNLSLLAKLEEKDGEILQLKQIINIMPGNVYWKNKEGVYLGCNDNCRIMLNFESIEDIIGKNIYDILGPEFSALAKEVNEQDLEIITSGKHKYFEEKGLNLDKQPAIYLSHKLPYYDAKHRVAGMVGISFDISDRKKMEQELKVAKERAEHATNVMSEFLSNMSHDVKTPLSGIVGISELLSRSLEGDNQDLSRILLSSSKQLLNFFNNCLEVFKMDTSDINLISTTFNLKNMLNELFELFKPAILNKKLIFQIHYLDYVPDHLIGNRASIYRILLNLIGNAVKFTHNGSITILVSLSRESYKDKNAKLILAVEDTGIGIAENNLKTIFERFTRLTPSYKGTYEGSGIGLYIVQKSVVAMGGEIEVNSMLGKGSQFIIQLPLDIPESLELEKETIEENKKVAASPLIKPQDKPVLTPKVLVIEDNAMIQRVQSSLLTSLNCKVEVAESGEVALEKFKPGKYDLIFVDIGLPEMQGDAAAKIIRNREEGTHHYVPIIALTAHTTDDIIKRCNEAGIDRVINKPMTYETAKEMIELLVPAK